MLHLRSLETEQSVQSCFSMRTAIPCTVAVKIKKNLSLTWKLSTRQDMQCSPVKMTQNSTFPCKTPITPTKMINAKTPNAE